MMRLEKIEAAANMQRYYVLDVSPTLFGEWMLTRCWGRIGKSGQVRQQTLPSEAAAKRLASALQQQKQRRGYTVIDDNNTYGNLTIS